ncbi:MAG: hypothetical protein Q8N39_11295 [Pelolinea sp.]|nr:hypothetical protein [Pelolinea sp.]
MRLWHFSLCDGDDRGDTRLRGQKIVIVVIELVGVEVKTNVEDAPLQLIEEVEVHLAHILLGSRHNLCESSYQRTRICISVRESLDQLLQPLQRYLSLPVSWQWGRFLNRQVLFS